MANFLVEKSMHLKGCINIDGAKNSALPILAATLLSKKKCNIKNIPPLKDIIIMQKLLQLLGAQINRSNNELKIDNSNIFNEELPYDLVNQIRASFLIAGPLLARFKKVRLQMPGGCAIGLRPIDLHLKGFGRLGAEIKQEHGIIEISASEIKGNDIYLDFPSVGATENIMMAAVMAKGDTTITNCAVEPEIVDLAAFLNKMGAKISGAGTDIIKITGVNCVGGCIHSIIPDRIEAGTFMIAAAITKGSITVKRVIPEHLMPVSAKLREIGMNITENNDSIEVSYNTKLKNTNIKTLPYPGFPTDMQAQFMGLMSVTDGIGIINETVFENRFRHVGELNRMGADIKIESKSAVIQGVERLTGTKVKATDLRAGAALILTALAADGATEVTDGYNVERGYYKFDEKLKSLGANIKIIE